MFFSKAALMKRTLSLTLLAALTLVAMVAVAAGDLRFLAEPAR